MSAAETEQAWAIIDLTVPVQPHPGFDERFGPVATGLREQLVGAIATMSEAGDQPNLSVQARLAQVGEQYKKELNTFNVIRSLDDYLHNRQWQYTGERQEEHQEEVLYDTLAGIADGNTEGHNEEATSTGKNYEIAKLAEACYLGGLRVLILSPSKTICYQNRGKLVEGKPDRGLAKFAPHILDKDIGMNFDRKRANKDHRVVVSTYQSLNNFADTGALGEFDVILADEAHKSLGPTTSAAMTSFSPHAVKIGFTASPRYGINKSVDEIFPYCYHQLPLPEAIERGLTAPVQSLVFATGVEIPNLDPGHSDFTPRELWRLANLKSRNELAVRLVKSFVQEGRQGTVPCVPGQDLAHARLMAELISKQEIIDPKTGHKRNIIARAVGNFLGDELQKELEAFERGEIDVLTYVKAIGEGWDSDVASFMVNTCPTTSIIKATQDLGRIIRRKANGLHSIAVDIVDETVGKQQMTARHVLGLDNVEFGKIYSSKSWSLDIGLDAETYIQGLLDADLYSRLEAVDGMLLSDLMLKPRQRQLRERLKAYYERKLVKDGLLINTHAMAVPPELEAAVRDYEDECVVSWGRWPETEEIIDYLLTLDSSDTKVLKKDYEFNVERALRARRVGKAGLLLNLQDESLSWAGRDPAEVLVSTIVLRETVREMMTLAGLTEKERDILMLRFGLDDGGENRTHEQVGKDPNINLTRERIRQIEARAMSKLRYADQIDGLREWLDSPVYLFSQRDVHVPYTTPRWPVKDWRKYRNWKASIGAAAPTGSGHQQPGAKADFSASSSALRYRGEQTTAYQQRLQQIVVEVHNYGDTAATIEDTIAEAIYGNLDPNFGGGKAQARRIIHQGLLLVKPTSDGHSVERPEMHNNWRLKRLTLERFNDVLPDILAEHQVMVTAVRQQPVVDTTHRNVDNDPRVRTAKEKTAQLLIARLNQVADDLIQMLYGTS